jgi:23S rRNA (guanosine2251-2'-O)-methyltransferase
MTKPSDRGRRRPPTTAPDPAVVAGRRAVTEAIRSGTATEVLVVPSSKVTQGLEEVLRAARAAGIPISPTPRARLDAMAGEHRGVVARVDTAPRSGGGNHGRDSPLRPVSERDLAEFPFDEDAIAVLLDGIVDPQNLGAAARSAEAAGAAILVTRTHRAAGVTPVAIRASAGALLHLPHARVANIARAIGRLQDAGFWVVGLDDAAVSSIRDEPCPSGRVAIVIGSEGSGMSRLVHERCDALVSLPMLGRVGSLNAAASLAAVLYAWVLPSR